MENRKIERERERENINVMRNFFSTRTYMRIKLLFDISYFFATLINYLVNSSEINSRCYSR